MAYQATVLSVMIASPGDVTEERNLIRDIIHEWNDINAKETKSVLLPVGWETHSSPDLAGRPQDIINKTVLEHCDLLVGVFWTRLGTPTGEFESGTVEEIKRHISGGKPAMIYFSTAPVSPASINKDQYDALQAFKEWCYGKGLVENYDHISEFNHKFRRQIQIKARERFSATQGTKSKESGLTNESSESTGNHINLTLSDEAKRLLLEAAKGENGTILSVRFIGGQSIQANGINFVDSKDRRSIARWEAALEQLIQEQLVVELGHEHEIFEVTDKGYNIADNLAQIM